MLEVYLTAASAEPGLYPFSAGALSFYSGYIRTYKKSDSLAGTFTAEILVIDKKRPGDDRRIR